MDTAGPQKIIGGTPPGAKIVEAFYKGYGVLDEDYEIICKYDADMVFESNYLLKLSQHFKENNRLGMAAGQCYIQKDDQWVLKTSTKTTTLGDRSKPIEKNVFWKQVK